jgi:hypothetical protein
MNAELKKSEEEKRDRCWNPRARWRVIEQTIAWVDSQQAIPRNSRQACLANQERLLRNLSPAAPLPIEGLCRCETPIG